MTANRLRQLLFDPPTIEKLSIAITLILLVFAIVAGTWLSVRIFMMGGFRREKYVTPKTPEPEVRPEVNSRQKRVEKLRKKAQKERFLTRFRRSAKRKFVKKD